MISIPNPCKEDFNKMTPTERGAYCTKCNTDTFDFRHLSDGQIYEILDEYKGQHICGRFKSSQLDGLSKQGYYNWKNQTSRTFQSKFVLACILVFGLTLFSCESEDERVIETIQIEQLIRDVGPKSQFINDNAHIEIKGVDLMDYVQEYDAVELENGCMIKEKAGEIEIKGNIIETEVNNYEYETAGAIAYNEVILSEEVIEIEDSTPNTSTLSVQELTDSRAFEATAYPNPTQINSTVAIDVENEGQYDVMMFNMNGQLIRQIHSGNLPEGRKTFEINMSNLKTGIYIIKVISQGQEETLKIQKIN
ncbi:MAG: T9SS type A sorting domain-containing protein [Crocinitomicaceae bacterium]|nr:T9SS type A sorting domain-containing protein [Crocinitomicaceae bacterium]